MISPRGEDGNWSMTIFRILISIESRRNIKSRRGIDESRSPNFPTIRKRFGGGRPTNVAESIVRHSRIGLAEVAVSAPAFQGTGVSVESLFGPFLLVHAPQHEAQSLFRSRTRGLLFSLSLSLPSSFLSSPPTEPSGYQYLCRFAFVGYWSRIRQKIAIPPSPLSAYRIAIFFLLFFPPRFACDF